MEICLRKNSLHFTDKPSEEKPESKEEKPEKEPLTEPIGENEQAPPAAKKNLFKIPAIHLSKLPNIIPKRLRSNNQQTEDLELGNGPNNKAGLASMETLDDSIKDNDTNKDVTDKAALNEEGLETVKVSKSHFHAMFACNVCCISNRNPNPYSLLIAQRKREGKGSRKRWKSW